MEALPGHRLAGRGEMNVHHARGPSGLVLEHADSLQQPVAIRAASPQGDQTLEETLEFLAADGDLFFLPAPALGQHQQFACSCGQSFTSTPSRTTAQG